MCSYPNINIFEHPVPAQRLKRILSYTAFQGMLVLFRPGAMEQGAFSTYLWSWLSQIADYDGITNHEGN